MSRCSLCCTALPTLPSAGLQAYGRALKCCKPGLDDALQPKVWWRGSEPRAAGSSCHCARPSGTSTPCLLGCGMSMHPHSDSVISFKNGVLALVVWPTVSPPPRHAWCCCRSASTWASHRRRRAC